MSALHFLEQDETTALCENARYNWERATRDHKLFFMGDAHRCSDCAKALYASVGLGEEKSK
jgi:hypothetical protein